MLIEYHIARAGGRSVLGSLMFALFNRKPSNRQAEIERQMDETIARIAKSNPEWVRKLERRRMRRRV